MRKDASHRSEQVSQLLYGERAEILQIKDEYWAFVRSFNDEYEGWCLLGQLCIIGKREFQKLPKFLTTNHFSSLITAEAALCLPLGASIKSGSIMLSGQKAKFKGKKVERTTLIPSAAAVVSYAHLLRNAPYQWGGRNMQGIDCSGFSQLVLALNGIQIPRDASQQALQGQTINFLQEAQCGDLAFFANHEGRINHVGILLNENTIIHATETAGCVVIDKIDQEGIVSKLLRKRTHSLRLIKRYF
jgi:cell wall-associated NlpC family hydrolase